MNPAEVCLTLPNFLIPYRNGGVEDYYESPETVGKLVLAVASKIFKGADISANLAPCEKSIYRQWLKVAENGIEKASREREKMQRAAAARWEKSASGEPPQAANLSPSGGRSPAPVRQTGTPQGAPVPARSPAPVRQTGTPQGATVPARSPAPVPRPNPNPSGGERRGGVKSIVDCVDVVAMFGGAGGGIADRINENPVRAALEITGETGDKRAENTFKKLLRTKGAGAFCDELFAFNSELKNGEEPNNRGAALVARLSEKPDVSAGR